MKMFFRSTLFKCLLISLLALSVIGGYVYHRHIQGKFSTYTVEKRIVRRSTLINIAKTPVKLTHYQQQLVKGELWSMLTVYSPKQQKIDTDAFKMYRGVNETPNIYFNEDFKVNSKSSLMLKEGTNRILTHGVYTNPHNLKLVILSQNGLVYHQDWLQSRF